MNVLLSAYACLPNSGSEPGNGWNWAVALAQQGLHVTVLTRVESKPELDSYLERNSVTNLTVAYVDVPVAAWKPASGPHYALWQARAVAVARKLHAAHPFDVVHHVTYTSIHVPTRLWKLGVPVVFGPVGGGQTAPPSMLPYFGASERKERLRTLFTRALRFSPWHRRWLRKMRVVLAANGDTLQLARDLGRPDAQLHFDNGVSPAYLATQSHVYTENAPNTRLLWVGRLLPRKALPLALDALAQTHPSVTLTIVGDGLPLSQVHAMIRDRELTGRVLWAGRRLSVEEVRAAYQEHDALLFTSVRETSGAQLLEAMASALPIITLDLHGARELVPDDAGYKVAVTTPHEVTRALAAAVDRFAALPVQEKARMSGRSLAFAHTCTWPLRAMMAEDLYRKIVFKTEVTTPRSP